MSWTESMLATQLYTKTYEIDARLARFGVTRKELVEIVQLILSARSDAIAADPLSAAGQFSYIYGTRHLRLLLCPKGWVIDRTDNVESVRHEPTGVTIVFQNVDQACSVICSPKALHGKGAAAVRMIDNGQGRLFEDRALPEAIPAFKIQSLNSAVWYFCMSFADDEAQAELSLPATLEGNNFEAFIERIFITLPDDPKLEMGRRADDGPAESEPTVSRR